MQTSTRDDNLLNRLLAQRLLFARRPSRPSLLDLPVPQPADTKKTRIQVWRNHAFEPLLPILEIYAAHSGWNPDFILGPYDDTLNFTGHQGCDLELLWIDPQRYKNGIAPGSFLEERIHSLRNISDSPILVVAMSPVMAEDTPDISMIYRADMETLCRSHDVKVSDERTAVLAGTRLGARAQLLAARELACSWIPAITQPPIKAILLDLDETLHRGVLSEDGIQGIEVQPGHLSLQTRLKQLRQSGVLLALVSRNEREDVSALFQKHADYVLSEEDFTCLEVSWGRKSEAITRIAESMHISTDAILFVDDNVGELAEAAIHHPAIRLVQAQPDALETQCAIDHEPGIWRWNTSSASLQRSADIKAGHQREALAKTVTDPARYLEALQTTLKIAVNEKQEIPRLTELCTRTNQFNLSLKRLNELALERYMTSPDSSVVSVALSDRLADSGIICVLVAVQREDAVHIEELCISCRALGRQLERSIISAALTALPYADNGRDIVFHVATSDRNMPARRFLEEFGLSLPVEGPVLTSFVYLKNLAVNPSIQIAHQSQP